MSANILGGRFSQIAYVTNDFDSALGRFACEAGVTRFLELRDICYPIGRGAEVRCHVALAMSGGMEIELIEPRGGEDRIYRQILDGSHFQLHLHHFAQALPSAEALAELKGELLRRGVALVIDGASNGMTYFYADLRTTLGHHMEYTFATPEYLATVGAAVPHN